jgi:hypothetical protein
MVCVLNDNVILLLSLNTFTSVFLNSIKSAEWRSFLLAEIDDQILQNSWKRRFEKNIR